jgi:hypothetical protein
MPPTLELDMVLVNGDTDVAFDLPDMGMREFIKEPQEKMTLFSGDSGGTSVPTRTEKRETARPLPPIYFDDSYGSFLSDELPFVRSTNIAFNFHNPFYAPTHGENRI